MYAMFKNQPIFGSCGVDIYSTEETRIGTWIDGKPIYRKVFMGPINLEYRANVRICTYDEYNIDTVTGSYGQIYRSTPIPNLCHVIPSQAVSFNNYPGQEISVQFALNESGTVMRFLVLEYTKTTDAATIVSSANTQSLSVSSLNASSQSSEKVLSAKVPLPSSVAYAPASAASASIGLAPASAASASIGFAPASAASASIGFAPASAASASISFSPASASAAEFTLGGDTNVRNV